MYYALQSEMAIRLLYQRNDDKWAWQLKADNGDIIATDGGQGYNDEGEARKMADAIIGGNYANADKRIRRKE